MTSISSPFNDPQDGTVLSLSFEFKVVCNGSIDIYKGYEVELEGVKQTSHICLYTPASLPQWHLVSGSNNLRELLFQVYGGPAEMRFTDLSVLRGDPFNEVDAAFPCELKFKDIVAGGRISFIKVELTLDEPADAPAAATAPASKNNP